MRLLSLILEYYGSYTDLELVFPNNGLCIIYGSNEAGKTTALHALSDLLYGFQHSTSYDFCFSAKDLRVGGKVMSSTGQNLSFRRRKGRERTLSSQDGHLLGDDSLAPFIGRSDRLLFEKAFGLSHKRLREGGEAMLQAGGDIGESLIEAGSGISNLLEIQQTLQNEADALFSPRRSQNKKIYQYLNLYQSASTGLRTATLGINEWHQAVGANNEANERFNRLCQEMASMIEEESKVNRLFRVLPLLRELDQYQNRLSELGETPELPEDAGQRRINAIEERSRAERDLQRAEENIKKIEDLLKQSPLPENLLRHKVEIEDLNDRLGEILGAMRDIPTVKAEANTENLRLEEISSRLGFSNVSELAQHQPNDLQITRLQNLIREGMRIQDTLNRTRESQIECQRAVEDLNEELLVLGSIENPTEGLHSLERLSVQEEIEQEIAIKQNQLSQYDKQLDEMVNSLVLWTSTLESLATAKLPGRESIRYYVGQNDENMKKRLSAEEKKQEALSSIEKARKDLDELKAEGEVPTQKILLEARSKRQHGWSLIRRKYIEGEDINEEELLSLSSNRPLPQIYEELVFRADDLADRRQAEAQRIAEYSTTQSALQAGERTLKEGEKNLDIVLAKEQQLISEWEQLWKPVGIAPNSPAEMLEWLEQVKGILDFRNQRSEYANQLREQETRFGNFRSIALDLADKNGLKFTSEASFSFILNTLSGHLKSQDIRWQQVNEQTIRKKENEKELNSLKKKHQEDKRKYDVWAEQWQEILPNFGLDPELSIEEGQIAVDHWRNAIKIKEQLSSLERRIKSMEKTCEIFSMETVGLVEDLAPDIKEKESTEMISILFGRLRQAETLSAKQGQQKQSLREWKQQQEDTKIHLQAAKDELSQLQTLANIEGEENLEKVIRMAEEYRNLKEKISDAQNRLIQAGDAFDEATLRKDSSDLEPTQLEQMSINISETRKRLESERDEANREIERTKTELDRLQSIDNAGETAQEVQDALSHLGTYTNDWIRLRTASVLLKTAIDRYRERNQTPLLGRAGEIFKDITQGSFEGFVVDYDEKDEPKLVGERPTGEKVTVEGMSDGTRDQLYFALRIAALENYCGNEEPLPFIGDDLFVHFDDDRAIASLKLLESITSCQVLLFTHHQHLVDLAHQHLDNNFHLVTL